MARTFATTSPEIKYGEAFLLSGFQRTNTLVAADGLSDSLKVFGEPKAIAEAILLVEVELNRLEGLCFTLALEEASLSTTEC